VYKSEQEDLGKQEEVNLLVSFLEKKYSGYDNSTLVHPLIAWNNNAGNLQLSKAHKECIFEVSLA